MTLRERIADRGRKVLSSPRIFKWSTDDRVKRAAESVFDMRSRAQQASIYTNPFITPGVPPKCAMLRTSNMATHERTHLDRALEAFHKAGKKFGVI